MLQNPIWWVPATLIILVVFFSQSTTYGTLQNRRCVSILSLFSLLFRIHSCTTYTFITVWRVLWCFNSHSRCLLLLSPRCTLKHKNENFEYFSGNRGGDGVANNLHDASHLPHFADGFLILFFASCVLTKGVTTPQLYFHIVDPSSIVTARDWANSQTCRKWGNYWNLEFLGKYIF